MKERVLSGIVYAALIMSAVALGGWYFVGIIGFMAIVCAYEFAKMMKDKGHTDNIIFVILGVVFIVLGMSVFDYVFSYPVVVILPLAAIMYREMRRQDGSLESGLVAWAGLLYLGLGFGSLMTLEVYNWLICLFAFLITVATDCGAFFVGCAIGKHKLMPRVSPKKSVEGAVGGILICVLACLTYNHFLLTLNTWQVVAIAVFCSLMGQLGDLLESFIKRYAGVKDSGNIMPGHGGLFDRLDSMMLVAPVLFFLLRIF